jgi:hypothetical protein
VPVSLRRTTGWTCAVTQPQRSTDAKPPPFRSCEEMVGMSVDSFERYVQPDVRMIPVLTAQDGPGVSPTATAKSDSGFSGSK